MCVAPLAIGLKTVQGMCITREEDGEVMDMDICDPFRAPEAG